MSRVMVDDSRRDAVFRKLRTKAGNKHCFDCGSRNPSWATPTFGVFVCLNCSASHRRMGVHISFMRSCELDSWSEDQLQRMIAGGNDNAKSFFARKGWRGQQSKIEEKYHSRAAGLYKAHLDRIAPTTGKLSALSPERGPSEKPPLTGFQALALSARSSPGPPGLPSRSKSTPGRTASTPSPHSASSSPMPLMSNFAAVAKKPKAARAAAAPAPSTPASAPAPSPVSSPPPLPPATATATSSPTAAATGDSGSTGGGMGLVMPVRAGGAPAVAKKKKRVGGLGGGLRGGLGTRKQGGLGGGLRGGLGSKPRTGGLGVARLGARKIGGGSTLGAAKLRGAPKAAAAAPADSVLGTFDDASAAAKAEAAAAAKRQEAQDAALARQLQENEDSRLAAAMAGGAPRAAAHASPKPPKAAASAPGSGDQRGRERLRSGEFAAATAISSDMLFGGTAAAAPASGRGRARTSSSDLAEFVGSIGGQVASDLGKAASRIGGLFKKGGSVRKD